MQPSRYASARRVRRARDDFRRRRCRACRRDLRVERLRPGPDDPDPPDGPRRVARDGDGRRRGVRRGRTRSNRTTGHTCSTSTRCTPSRSARRRPRSRPRRTTCSSKIVPAARRSTRWTTSSRRRSTPFPTARPRPRASASAPRPQLRCSRFRENDGYLAAFPFDIGSGAGDWRPVGWPFALPDPRGRPGRLGGEREAVPDRDAVAVPDEGAERADEPRVREGLRRGEVARGHQQHDADGRPDRRGGLLAVRADRALEPGRTRPARTAVRARHGRPGAPLRDHQPRGCRRGDQLLERQVPLAVLAAARRDPRGGHGREPRDGARPDLGVAVRPGDADHSAARHAAVP